MDLCKKKEHYSQESLELTYYTNYWQEDWDD